MNRKMEFLKKFEDLLHDYMRVYPWCSNNVMLLLCLEAKHSTTSSDIAEVLLTSLVRRVLDR